jgi:hypothetical protein
LIIRATKDDNDGKYYLLAWVYSNNRKLCVINFLLDTGASSTMISWNDARDNKISTTGLLMHTRRTTGVGGGIINNYILPSSVLFFAGWDGWIQQPIQVYISDSKTIDGNNCTRLPSYIGMDILSRFDLYTKGIYAYLTR